MVRDEADKQGCVVRQEGDKHGCVVGDEVKG